MAGKQAPVDILILTHGYWGPNIGSSRFRRKQLPRKQCLQLTVALLFAPLESLWRQPRGVNIEQRQVLFRRRCVYVLRYLLPSVSWTVPALCHVWDLGCRTKYGEGERSLPECRWGHTSVGLVRTTLYFPWWSDPICKCVLVTNFNWRCASPHTTSKYAMGGMPSFKIYSCV